MNVTTWERRTDSLSGRTGTLHRFMNMALVATRRTMSRASSMLSKALYFDLNAQRSRPHFQITPLLRLRLDMRLLIYRCPLVHRHLRPRRRLLGRFRVVCISERLSLPVHVSVSLSISVSISVSASCSLFFRFRVRFCVCVRISFFLYVCLQLRICLRLWLPPHPSHSPFLSPSWRPSYR